MKALVTGGAGLIGSHVADLLLQKGYEVKILDNLDSSVHLGKKPDWIPEEAEFIEGEILNEKDLDRAIRGVNIIFHQAAFGGFTSEIARYFQVNTVGTGLIMQLVASGKYPVEKMVVASSQAVYGEGMYKCAEHEKVHPGLRPLKQLIKQDWEVHCPQCGRPMTAMAIEENDIDPKTPYAMSKFTEEEIVMKIGATHDIPAVALRYSVTYGPRQSIYNPYTGICSIFSTRILNDLPPVIYEDGNQTRDFIYVGDVARANLLVAEKEEANFKVFNVGTGKATSVMDFVGLIAGAYGKKLQTELRGNFRPGDVRHLFADNSKLCRLGWKPQVTLADGIALYAEWIQSQGRVKDYFSEAEILMKQMKVVRESLVS
jgi:dTDP-L-rhamnose 4-epimerase